MKKFWLGCLCFVLALTLSLCFVGCSAKDVESQETTPFGDEYYNNIGAGRKSFYFEFVDANLFSQKFQINSDSTYLLEALRENNMVLTAAGEPITTIVGNVADDTNSSQWVLYKNGVKVDGDYEQVEIVVKEFYKFVIESK